MKETDTETVYLSIKDASAISKMSEATLRGRCNHGQIAGAVKMPRTSAHCDFATGNLSDCILRWMIPSEALNGLALKEHRLNAPEGFISAAHLSGRTGYTPGWICRMCRNGVFQTAVKVGATERFWVIEREEANRWMKKIGK